MERSLRTAAVVGYFGVLLTLFCVAVNMHLAALAGMFGFVLGCAATRYG